MAFSAPSHFQSHCWIIARWAVRSKISVKSTYTSCVSMKYVRNVCCQMSSSVLSALAKSMWSNNSSQLFHWKSSIYTSILTFSLRHPLCFWFYATRFMSHFNDILPRHLLWNVFRSSSIPFIAYHDDVIKWKHFPRYWPFVLGIPRWIPGTKASDAEIWYFLWTASE